MPSPDESPNPNKGRSSGTAKQAQAAEATNADDATPDDSSSKSADKPPSATEPPVVKPKDPASAPAATADATEPEAEAATFADAIAEDPGAAPGAETADLSPSDVLSTVTAERDEYLAAMQRLKAEFANHKRRTSDQQTQQREQAAAGLVEKLLPVLDGCDAAMAHEPDAVRPIHDSLTDVLTKAGLTRIEPEGDVFDPESHEAVMHEEGDGSGEPLVVEVLRAGYSWNGRVIRPAMVKVKG